jgi:hypothetical protein
MGAINSTQGGGLWHPGEKFCHEAMNFCSNSLSQVNALEWRVRFKGEDPCLTLKQNQKESQTKIKILIAVTNRNITSKNQSIKKQPKYATIIKNDQPPAYLSKLHYFN